MKVKFKDYIPHIGQQQFHASTSDEVLVVSPIRSGKTHSLIHDIIKNAWNNPTKHGILACAPTILMLNSLIERPIVEIASKLNILKNHSSSRHETVLINDKKIYYRALEKYDRVRGLNVSKAYIDEVCQCSRQALDVVKGRLLTTNGQLKMITTPAGTSNFIYEDYIKNKKDNCDYIYYNLRDNPEIQEEAIIRLYSSLDPLTAKQELEGEWVNLYEDLVYYSFSQANIGATSYKPTPIYIGLDFNINKNCWVALQRQADNSYQCIHEGYGARTTPDVARQILDYVQNRHYIVVPDATGDNNLQGIAITQIQLLKQAGLNNIVIPHKSNPKRVVRYAIVNGALHNGLDQHRLIIDPKCKTLIDELNILSYKKGTTEPDSLNGKLGHITDALGYVLNYLDHNRISRKI